MSFNNKLISSGALLLVWLVSILILFPGLSNSLSPDSLSYIGFSQYRQPLYGFWCNAIFPLVGSWAGVKLVQIILFTGSMGWLIVELALIGKFGVVAGFCFVLLSVVLVKFGLLELVGTIISEGLFYSLIAACVAIFLRWIASRRVRYLVSLVLILVLMSQLRSAAILVIGVAAIVPLLAFSNYRSLDNRAKFNTKFVLVSLIVASVMLPVLLGKPIAKLGTQGDRVGFVMLPRVSLLPLPVNLTIPDPRWKMLNTSWRAASANLSVVGLTQFDAQLQEAIRFGLAPNLLLPALLDSKELDQHKDATSYHGAKRVALTWIFDQWPAYLSLSAKHMWGMLTMGNFMANSDRASVWRALDSVSELTWQFAEFRTDYPLNKINESLKPGVQAVYIGLRLGSFLLILLGSFCILQCLYRFYKNRPIPAGSLVMAMGLLWTVLHSLPAALTVFPEFRYTFANSLALFASGAVWLAYLPMGHDEI